MRRVRTDDHAVGHQVGDRTGEKAVAATDVEDAVGAVEFQPGHRLRNHRALQAAEPGVLLAAPVRHRDSQRETRPRRTEVFKVC